MEAHGTHEAHGPASSSTCCLLGSLTLSTLGPANAISAAGHTPHSPPSSPKSYQWNLLPPSRPPLMLPLSKGNAVSSTQGKRS